MGPGPGKDTDGLGSRDPVLKGEVGRTGEIREKEGEKASDTGVRVGHGPCII